MVVAKDNSKNFWHKDLTEREQDENILTENGLSIEVER